jgi:hypothetical protein
MLRRFLKFAAPTIIFMAVLLVSSLSSQAKPDYMKRENKACTYCHNAPNKKSLNDIGKCYAEHGHTLDKCDPRRPVGALN